MLNKKHLAALSAVAFAATLAVIPSEAQAAKKYGMGGCGLGASPSPSQFRQIVASVINSIFGSTQTSAITSGTSKCSDEGIVKAHYEQKIYVASNLSELEKNTVRGQGEKLENLAFLMGCSEESMVTFSAVAKKNYNVIFAEKEDGSDWVLHRFKQTVASHQNLSKTCKKVWL